MNKNTFMDDCKLDKDNPNKNKIVKNIPLTKTFEKASEIFQLISDSSRLRILWLLCHCELCVNNIAIAVNMSAPAVSHHLKMLKQNGLIENRRDGKEIYYTISKTLEAELVHKSIDDMLNIKCPK